MLAFEYVFTDDVIRHHRDNAFDRLGNIIVNRFDQLETLIEWRPRLCPCAVLKSLVECFVHANLPISQIDAPFFLNFVSCINLGIASDLPNSHQLRSPIIQRVVALRNSINAATSGNRSVSLMTDSLRKAGRAWLGICLATASQLHFWCLVHEVDHKSSTIANIVADTVLGLPMWRLIVWSIVADNTSNECAVLNPEFATSMQRVTGINVFRNPCLSHRGNLRTLGTKRAIPCDVWIDLISLRDGLTN
jgi:hypothetical protein